MQCINELYLLQNAKGIDQGDVSIQICRLTKIGIPMLKIRRSYLYMGIPYLGKTTFVWRWGPGGSLQMDATKQHPIQAKCTLENIVTWASWQMRKLRVAHAPGTFSLPPRVSDARVVIHAVIANYRFSLKLVVVKTFPAFPAYEQAANFRIW